MIPEHLSVPEPAPPAAAILQHWTIRDEGGFPLATNDMTDTDTIPTVLAQQRLQRTVAAFTDSRARWPLPTEVGMIRRIHDHLPNIEAVFLTVRQRYFPHQAGDLSIQQLQTLLAATQALPSYLTLRKDQPVAAIPTPIADAYKASLGMIISTNAHADTRPPDDHISATDIYSYANTPAPKKPPLVGERFVCPAPPKTIVRLADTIISGNPPVSDDHPTKTVLASVDMDRLSSFAKAKTMLEDIVIDINERIRTNPATALTWDHYKLYRVHLRQAYQMLGYMQQPDARIEDLHATLVQLYTNRK